VGKRAKIMVPVLVVAIAAFGLVYIFGGTGKITAWQLRLHPESSLTYPRSYRSSSAQNDEDDANGWFRIENTDPTPALAETQFYTTDSVDRVVAWYEQWLSAHGWQDVVAQGDGSRSWDRGTNEQFEVSCGHQRDSPDLWCDVQYYILSSRFKLSYAPAPRLTDPVSQGAVEQRQVGLLAVGASTTDPQDGTAEAQAARLGWSNWPHETCCGVPVILLNASSPEQISPAMSAFHVITLQAAEYDAPSLHDIAYFGKIASSMSSDFEYAGFVRINSESTQLFGQPATAVELTRDNREAVIYAISYGQPVQESGYSYRVTTVSIIYDVAPQACSLSAPACLALLFKGDASTGWSF
jgi:hypothetical protein